MIVYVATLLEISPMGKFFTALYILRDWENAKSDIWIFGV